MRELVERYVNFVVCLRDLEVARPRDPDPGFDLDAFRRPLVDHIRELKPPGVVGLGSEERRLLQRAQYAMAVLADEVMTVGEDWAGTDAWSLSYLETEFAGTEEGGDRIFENMDEILRLRDPSTIELASVYLLTLALGFRGLKASRQPERQLEREQQAHADRARGLYMFAASKSPLEQLIDEQLFPSAYKNTEQPDQVPKHARSRGWALVFVASLLVCAVVTTLLWEVHTRDISDLVERVEGKGLELQPIEAVNARPGDDG